MLGFMVAAPLGVAIWGFLMAAVRLLVPVYWCRNNSVGIFCWQTAATISDWIFGFIGAAVSVYTVVKLTRRLALPNSTERLTLKLSPTLRWLLALPLGVAAMLCVVAFSAVASLLFFSLHFSFYADVTRTLSLSLMAPMTLIAVVVVICPTKKNTIAWLGPTLWMGALCAVALTSRSGLIDAMPRWILVLAFVLNGIGVVGGALIGLSVSDQYIESDRRTPAAASPPRSARK